MDTRALLRRGAFARAAGVMLVWSWMWLMPPEILGQASSPVALIQESSTPVSYVGTWSYEDTHGSWSGGTAATATTPGARATLAFSGVGVRWIGLRGPQAGIAHVFLDGIQAATIDLFTPAEQVRAVLFDVATLTDETHTLTIDVTGERNILSGGTLVVVDAFEITPGAGGLVDTVRPLVTLISPLAGATVPTGFVLRAQASDDFAVTGVRFYVDDVDISGELVIAPYWVAWDTASVAEGAHTLTVVARDAAGNADSDDIPVTIDRTPPAVSVTSPVSGTTVSDVITIAAAVSDNSGIDDATFTANGVVLDEETAPPFQVVWDTTLVSDGSYTLKVAARDRAGGLNSTVTTVTVLNGTTRIEESDATITYSGTWAQGNGARAWSGGSAAIANLTAQPAQATVRFNGTGVTWIGFQGPQAGIARVSLDDVQVATVDLFESIEHVQAVAFKVTGLAPGPHSLIVEATGSRNPLSTDPFVVIDAFVIFGAPPVVEETDAGITYSGTWAQGNGARGWSGDTAAVATQTEFPAQAELRFNGSGVTWIGFRGPQAGIANVSLDGTRVASVDLFDSVEHVQAIAYEVTGLAPGQHTLIVEATGSRNPLSTDPFVVIDAFKISER